MMSAKKDFAYRRAFAPANGRGEHERYGGGCENEFRYFAGVDAAAAFAASATPAAVTISVAFKNTSGGTGKSPRSKRESTVG
jgi:hypothetical protein